MTIQKKHTGFAIAIAWPETYCKQPGYWYDAISNFLGLSDNHYYKVGHAALVLVDPETRKCHYFDFGRYQSPFQHGRVRSEQTDDGLKMKTPALISEDGRKIENLEEILTELQLNPECHGEGKIHGSYGRINFHRAFSKAFYLQQKSPIPYGPFRYKGSNCSRFVNSALIAGKPSWLTAFKLNYLVPLTPTPINNVNSFENKVVLPKLLTNEPFCPSSVFDKSKLKGTLPEPERPKNILEFAQWLSGEGSGSWFSISPDENDKYFISRFGPNGELECRGEFVISNNQSFNINLPFRFEHLSHCRKVRIRQENHVIEFRRID
ncbi:MAG: hypothetical protein Q8N05_18700 [Bacteroidota bacterium]|nr:hypothetical protein [Bacteroidota bacterium]